MDITPEQFWSYTPAEVDAMMERVTNKDSMMWNHTSQIVWAVLAPHQPKGKSIRPLDFHPYLKDQRRKELLDSQELEQLRKKKMDSGITQKRLEQFRQTGKKSVWDKLKKDNGRTG